MSSTMPTLVMHDFIQCNVADIMHIGDKDDDVFGLKLQVKNFKTVDCGGSPNCLKTLGLVNSNKKTQNLETIN